MPRELKLLEAMIMYDVNNEASLLNTKAYRILAAIIADHTTYEANEVMTKIRTLIDKVPCRAPWPIGSSKRNPAFCKKLDELAKELQAYLSDLEAVWTK